MELLSLDDILDRAFRSAASRLWRRALPQRKYRKRNENRNKLYRKNLRLGKVKRLKKGGR